MNVYIVERLVAPPVLSTVAYTPVVYRGTAAVVGPQLTMAMRTFGSRERLAR